MPQLSKSIPGLLCLSHVHEEAPALTVVGHGRQELALEQLALGDSRQVKDRIIGTAAVQNEGAGPWDEATGGSKLLLLIADKEGTLDAGFLPATRLDIPCEQCGVVGHSGVVLDGGDIALEDGEIDLVDGVLSLVLGRADGLWWYGWLRLSSSFGIESVRFVVGGAGRSIIWRTTSSSATGMIPLLLRSARCGGAHDGRRWCERCRWWTTKRVDC